jgi:hypothetical protein
MRSAGKYAPGVPFRVLTNLGKVCRLLLSVSGQLVVMPDSESLELLGRCQGELEEKLRWRVQGCMCGFGEDVIV